MKRCCWLLVAPVTLTALLEVGAAVRQGEEHFQGHAKLYEKAR